MADQRRRFLVVHNNEQESGAIVTLFESLGQKVSATWSGREALDCLAADRFDLLLVDEYVADMYVGDFIERVLRMANRPRVVIMDTSGRFKTIRYDKSLGECHILDKGNRDEMSEDVARRIFKLYDTPLN